MNHSEFRETVWQKGRELYRDMPWRAEPTFYNVLVSEVMLQQTQVPRVLTKYYEWMMKFPTIEVLAGASLAEVVVAWQGLGYNRRAKFLHDAARQLASKPLPNTQQTLSELPGIGTHTAGAMMNYIYSVPTPFIETNIRSVYFHHFFMNATDIADSDLLQLVEETMDRKHPRRWFWALMDYGAWLKSQKLGTIAASRHYKKQSPLRGSIREVRGQIIRVLTDGAMSLTDLRRLLEIDNRFEKALAGLVHDQLVTIRRGTIYLTK